MSTSTSSCLFTGRHMFLIMMTFFAVVFLANMSLVYFASQSWTGLVVKNSYVSSQEFDKTTRKLEAASAGVHVAVSHANGMLTLTLSDNGQKAVFASNVIVRLGRPTHEGEDRTIALTAAGNGIFSSEFNLARGQWSGMVSADVIGHEHWRRPIRILVKD
jgi:nitrogen fixation protein FixH